MSEKNTGKPYEVFTQRIFQEILHQTSVKNVIVEHNVILKGKTTDHQIDVYWKFETGAIVYETIVQAKDWGQPVDQGELLLFKAILDDLPNQPRGVFVTKTGYQSGAKEVAEKNGILLYELREMTDADWEGCIKVIEVQMLIQSPNTNIANLILDNDWLKEEKERLGIPSNELGTIQAYEFENPLNCYDERKIKYTSFQEIINQKCFTGSKPDPKEKQTILFDRQTFFKTSNPKFPWLKVKGAEVFVEVREHKRTIRIDGGDIVSFILKNITKGEETRFGKDLKMLGKPENDQ